MEEVETVLSCALPVDKMHLAVLLYRYNYLTFGISCGVEVKCEYNMSY